MIKGSCQSRGKVVTHDSKSDLPLVLPKNNKPKKLNEKSKKNGYSDLLTSFLIRRECLHTYHVYVYF